MAISSLVTTFLGPDILPYFDDPDIVEIYTTGLNHLKKDDTTQVYL